MIIVFLKAVSEVRFFNVKKNMYIWDNESSTFYKAQGLDRLATLSTLHTYQEGLVEGEREQR